MALPDHIAFDAVGAIYQELGLALKEVAGAYTFSNKNGLMFFHAATDFIDGQVYLPFLLEDIRRWDAEVADRFEAVAARDYSLPDLDGV